MRLIPPTIEHVQQLMTWFPDAASVYVWGGRAFRYPFTEQSFLEDMHWGQMPTFAMLDDHGDMAGFGQLYIKLERTHLARLAVAPSKRGKGNGASLVQLLIDAGREQFPHKENSLYVMRGNERALRCYLSAGFAEVALPAGEFAHPDQVFMVRKENGMQSDEDAIRDLVTAWLAATKAADAPKVLRLMSDDVVFLTPGRPPMRGKATFAAAQASNQAFEIDAQSDIQEIEVLGEWAYMWTHLTVVAKPKDGSAPIKRAGHTMSILRKENGAWVIVRDANMLAVMST